MEINEVTGIFLCLASYYLAQKLYERFQKAYLNPLFIAIILTIFSLEIFNISYEDFMLGGQVVNFLILPATVFLAVPFYKNRHVFMRYKKAILAGSFLGGLVALASVFLLGKWFQLDRALLVSLLPKSITTAFALPLAEEAGGYGPIASFAVIFTGVMGSMVANKIFDFLKIQDPIAQGAALGTASHAAGTSQAISISEVAAAISGLCLVLTGFFTILLFPLFLKLL